MAELGAAAIGAGAALGAAAYTAANGFAARHESNHSLQASETRRNISDFEAAYERGEVSEEDWQDYLKIRADARNRESEYEESIEAYKETPLYLFLEKWKKKRQVRKKKKALRRANRSLRNHFYEATSESSDTSSINASSGSPTRSRKVHSDDDDERILSWAEDVVSPDSEDESRVSKRNDEGPSSLTDPLKNASRSAQPNSADRVSAEGLHSSRPSFGSRIPSGPWDPDPRTRVGGGSATLNGPTPPSAQHQQEDISTIFVVGLPNDMQEREFQNMFTFSSGFDTAILKSSKQEYTPPVMPSGDSYPYGIYNTPAPGFSRSFNGFNNPYTFMPDGNIMASPLDGFGNPGQLPSGSGPRPNVLPRKQIIGFARFHTREEAIRARDQLHGRCVDILKGTVVKAELAKKNLHRKREFGPMDGRLANPGSFAPTFTTATVKDTSNSANDKFALDAREGDYHMWYQSPGMLGIQDLLRDLHAAKVRKDATLAATGIPSASREGEDGNREGRDTDNRMVYMGPGNTTAFGTPWPPPPSWGSLVNGMSNNVSSPPVHRDYSTAATLDKNITPTVGKNQGSITPQLPAPSSGASTSTISPGKVDQNPPINTLYVGNLPTSPPPPPYAPDALEKNLRDLFHKQPGYRQLMFRQKPNGPMCFVEFEDVQFATKALDGLYGNTLYGLVKGGIRLSYSKNPFSTRTPMNYRDLVST